MMFHGRDGGSVEPCKEFRLPVDAFEESSVSVLELADENQLVVDISQTLGNSLDSLVTILKDRIRGKRERRRGRKGKNVALMMRLRRDKVMDDMKEINPLVLMMRKSFDLRSKHSGQIVGRQRQEIRF